MAPQTVVIVGGVLITIGAGIAIKEYAWPHIKEFVEPKLRKFRDECELRLRSTFTPRRRVAPHHHRTGSVESYYDYEHKEKGLSSPHGSMPVDWPSGRTLHVSSHPSSTVGENSGTLTEGQMLRKRQNRGTDASETDVEMQQLDKAKIIEPLPPVKMQHNSPSMNDINPFEEMKDITPPRFEAAGVPLPQSPVSSSLSAASNKSDDLPQSIPSLDLGARSGVLPHPSTPPHAPRELDLGTPRSPPVAALSPIIASTNWSVSDPMSPPQLTDSQISRLGATSPPLSEAAWTEGGTDRIFSDSEHEFRGHESDDDVRSVSDEGSWESVSAGPASPNLGATGRLAR